MANQANLSQTTVQATVRFEKQLSTASIGTIWLGRLLNGNDAGRVVMLRRITRQWLSLKDAEWVMYGAEAYAKVRHPSIVKLLGVLEQGDDLLSVSEHLEGVRLLDLQRTVFDEGVPIPATVSVRLVLDAARATWQAHRLASGVGIFPAERLFLPEGVYITNYGATLLTEIGVLAALARCVVPRTVPDLLAQLAPDELGARSKQAGSPEVFSLGVVLWELLANRWLFNRDSDSRTHQELLLSPIPSLDSIERFGMPVPDPIVELVRQATERDPTARFASVNDLVLAIERLPAHFIASEQQVSEVLRQRASAFLRESRGDESDRATSGTFSELRSTQPSIAPSSATNHDWDQPTFAQRSLLDCGPSATPMPLEAPSQDSLTATQHVSVSGPRRGLRRVVWVALTGVALAGAIFAFQSYIPTQQHKPVASPAPAARIAPARLPKAPAPSGAPAAILRTAPNAAAEAPAAPQSPNPTAGATSAPTPALPSDASAAPAPSSLYPSVETAANSALPSVKRVTTPRRPLGARRNKSAKASSSSAEGSATEASVDAQWGI